ncbi:MAG: 6-bladed beta-propeller [Gemmatimonadota bacterium]
MRRAYFYLVIASWIIGGCGEEATGDSVAADIDLLPEWKLVKEQRIGRANDPDTGFTRVGAIAEDRHGSVYVLDAAERQVRVFGADGRMIRRIGRAGAGPGEFDLPVEIDVIGDTLSVFDMGSRRITLFSTGGDVLGVVPTKGVPIKVGDSAPVSVAPRRLRSDGKFNSTVRIASRHGALPDSLLVPELLFNTRGEVTDTIRWRMFYPDKWPEIPLRNNGTVSLTNIPDRGAPLFLAGERRRVVVERKPAQSRGPDYIRLLLYRENDSTEHRFRYRPNRGIKRKAVVSGIVQSSGLLTRGGMSASEARQTVEKLVSVPEYQPPVSRVMLGADQSIWLQREQWTRDNTAMVEHWVVLDMAANTMARVILPERSRLRWASLSHIWVVEADELGIPYVVRYRLAS